MTEANQHAPAPGQWDEELDLRRLAHSIWRRRVAVLLLAVLGASAGLGISLFNSRYVSEGVFLVPDLTLDQYKRYESALANEIRLVEFLEHGYDTAQPAAEMIRELIARPERVAEAVRPEFRFTERDAKFFGVRFEDKNALVGMRLKLSQKERSREAPLRLLAEYVRDTAIKVDVEAILLDACVLQQTRELELRNLQIEGEFLVRQQEDKAATLRSLIERTPGGGANDARQVVSLARGGERFLAPSAQLVAAEVQIADYRLEQATRERELVAASLKRDYYCAARDLLKRPGTGRGFLAGLEALQQKVLANSDMQRDIVEHTANAFNVERQRWTSLYIERMRLVASPEGSQVLVRKPGRALGTLLGGLVGLLLGVLAALLYEWLAVNRAVIFARD